jgi:DNA-binding GntR family transcriptional regulator
VRAAELLRDAIVRGDLTTGSALRQDELAALLGISRIPLREALKLLEGEGFVQIRPHRGAVVAPLSEEEIVEMFEIVRLLEVHALGLSVPRLRDRELEQAALLLDELDRTSDLAAWASKNWEFHALLYGAAERPRLLELVKALRANSQRYTFMLLADERCRALLNREHRALLEACRRRDPLRAAQLLDEHLSGGKERVLRMIPREQ